MLTFRTLIVAFTTLLAAIGVAQAQVQKTAGKDEAALSLSLQQQAAKQAAEQLCQSHFSGGKAYTGIKDPQREPAFITATFHSCQYNGIGNFGNPVMKIVMDWHCSVCSTKNDLGQIRYYEYVGGKLVWTAKDKDAHTQKTERAPVSATHFSYTWYYRGGNTSEVLFNLKK